MSVIPVDILNKLKAVIRKIEMAAAFDGQEPHVFNELTSLNSLTRVAGMSERSLRDWFKILTGESVSKYASRRRTEYAARIFRLFPNASNSEVSRIIGLSNTPALYPFMKKQGIDKIDMLKSSFNTSEFNIMVYRFERLPECILFYTLEDVSYGECSSAEFEIENWDRIEKYIKERFSTVTKIGDVGFAIDKYMENKLEEGLFISGVIYKNIPTVCLPKDLIGDIGWRGLPSRKYAVFTHKGDYKYLSEVYYSALYTLHQKQNIQIEKSLLIMEKYLNSPLDTPTEELMTEIWVPIVS